MRLGTRLECVRSSPRVSRVCQDSAREFARRRLRLVGRLSGVTNKLSGRLTMMEAMELQPVDGPRSSLGIGPGSDDAVDLVEVRQEIRRRDREARWEYAGRSPKEYQKTHCKNTEGCRIGES
ncbi:hypothetical protein BHE74_00056186 [Ensete ventricosum]|nr:hypothetical protein BHE74_00056186 [Ensete ventricosum]